MSAPNKRICCDPGSPQSHGKTRISSWAAAQDASLYKVLNKALLKPTRNVVSDNSGFTCNSLHNKK